MYLWRHGIDRPVAAHLIDHKRNVAALCGAGCDRVLAIASVGGLSGQSVGDVVIPDDLLAFGATDSYFDDVRGHEARGFDPHWRSEVVAAFRGSSDNPTRTDGIYAHVRGPRYETPAEVRVLARFADVVGMTIAAECFLAAEAGLAYAAICVVDNVANGLSDSAITQAQVESARADQASRLRADLARAVARLAESDPRGPAVPT